MDEYELMPDPELLSQYRELMTSDTFSYSNPLDLVKYLRRQPPKSEDAVRVGDLLIQMRGSVREQVDPSALDVSNYDWEDYTCRCSIHMMGITVWYRLAVMLDPDNPTPYERLAQEVWWDVDEWPGTTLKLLERRGSYDETTLKRVMGQYRKEDSELVKQFQETMNSL